MSAGVERGASLTANVPASWHGPVMAALGGLFFLRVIGQVLVRYAGVRWLPAEEHWQSGLLPYPSLLVSQVMILSLIAVITRDAWRGEGTFVERRPRVGRLVRAFGVAYAGSMVIRYIVTMALFPEWRWFGHSIPTAFHLVLATFVLVYSGVLLHGTSYTRRRWSGFGRHWGRMP